MNRVVLKCVPKKGTTFFQARVTYFRIVVITKVGSFGRSWSKPFKCV